MKMATRYRKPKCYGFDLEKGILFPFSAATDLAADFFLTAIPGDAYTPRQRILFGVRLFSTNDCNGITVVRQHPSSIYPYATRLPQGGWQTSRDFTITQEGDGSQTSTFPSSGYIGFFKSSIQQGARENVILAYCRMQNGCCTTNAAIMPRFSAEQPSTLQLTWFTSSVSNGVFLTQAMAANADLPIPCTFARI